MYPSVPDAKDLYGNPQKAPRNFTLKHTFATNCFANHGHKKQERAISKRFNTKSLGLIINIQRDPLWKSKASLSQLAVPQPFTIPQTSDLRPDHFPHNHHWNIIPTKNLAAWTMSMLLTCLHEGNVSTEWALQQKTLHTINTKMIIALTSIHVIDISTR